MEKKFIAYWGDGYGEPYAEIFKGTEKIAENYGYSTQAREALERIEVLQQLDLSDISGIHCIVRVK